MKTQTIILAAAAVAIVGVVAYSARRNAATPNPTTSASADTARLAGVQAMYNMSAGQQNAVQAAVQANWKNLQDSVFATEPDFWV